MTTSIATRTTALKQPSSVPTNEPRPTTIDELIKELQAISKREGGGMPVFVHQHRALKQMRLSKRRFADAGESPRLVYRDGTRCLVLHSVY